MSNFTNTKESNKNSCTPKSAKILLDRSGSMHALMSSLIKGTNDLLIEQKQEAEDSGNSMHIQIYTFDTFLEKVRDGPIESIDLINADEIKARGSTALNDSMATILDEGKDDKDVLFFIFTDGHENASIKHREDAGRMYCKSLIEKYRRDNNWTVLFGAANIDAYQTGNAYGIPEAMAFNVDSNAPTVGNMMRAVSNSIRESSSNGKPIDVENIRQMSAPIKLNNNEDDNNSLPPPNFRLVRNPVIDTPDS